MPSFSSKAALSLAAFATKTALLFASATSA
jgi:hypothetical protein